MLSKLNPWICFATLTRHFATISWFKCKVLRFITLMVRNQLKDYNGYVVILILSITHIHYTYSSCSCVVRVCVAKFLFYFIFSLIITRYILCSMTFKTADRSTYLLCVYVCNYKSIIFQ